MILITPLPGVTTTKPGSATQAVPRGRRGGATNEAGDEVGPGGGGYLVLRRPWPAMLRGIYGDDARYRETYWSKYGDVYFAGDGARIDDDGDFWLLGRVDDVMNVSGHRISTIEVESALVDHHEVAEAAVAARNDAMTGQAIVAFVTLKGGAEGSVEKLEELRNHVATKIGPIAKPANIVFTPELPKTRSGKIMRRLLRDVAENRPLGDTTTLADPTVVEELQTPRAPPRLAGGLTAQASSCRKRSGSSNGPITARCSLSFEIRSCATRWTSSTVTASSSASTSSGSSALPSSTSRRRPNMISPCGLSVWSTKRPLRTSAPSRARRRGRARRPCAGTARRSTLTASSIRVMSTPACETSEPVSV